MILDLASMAMNTFCTRALDLKQPEGATAWQLTEWAKNHLAALWRGVQNFSCVEQDITKGNLGGRVKKRTQFWSASMVQVKGERSEVRF